MINGVYVIVNRCHEIKSKFILGAFCTTEPGRNVPFIPPPPDRMEHVHILFGFGGSARILTIEIIKGRKDSNDGFSAAWSEMHS